MNRMDTHTLINLLHIFVIVPFLLYVSIMKTDIPEQVSYFLMGLGGFVTVYHAYKLFIRFKMNSGFAWINAIHALYVGPLLFYIGYKQKDTPRSAFELLMLLAFAAGGYHIYGLAASNSMINGSKGGAESKTVNMNAHRFANGSSGGGAGGGSFANSSGFANNDYTVG